MLIGTRVKSRAFEYQGGRLLQEISTLQAYVSGNIFGQLYDDAADQGFVMVSQRTGKEMPFCLEETSRNGDGDVEYWKFRAVKEDDFGRFMTALVFND